MSPNLLIFIEDILSKEYAGRSEGLYVDTSLALHCTSFNLIQPYILWSQIPNWSPNFSNKDRVQAAQTAIWDCVCELVSRPIFLLFVRIQARLPSHIWQQTQGDPRPGKEHYLIIPGGMWWPGTDITRHADGSDVARVTQWARVTYLLLCPCSLCRLYAVSASRCSPCCSSMGRGKTFHQPAALHSSAIICRLQWVTADNVRTQHTQSQFPSHHQLSQK